VTPVLWIDGGQPTYSDAAGSVISYPFAGRVRYVNFHPPTAGSAISPAGARAFREGGAINFEVGASSYLNATVATPCVQNSITIAISFDVRDKPEGSAQCLLCNGPLRIWLFSLNILTVDYNGEGGNWLVAPVDAPTNYALAALGSRCIWILRISPTDMRSTVIFDGVRTDYVTSSSQPPAAATALAASGWYLGWDGVTGPLGDSLLHGAVSQAIVVDRVITDAENDALATWLKFNQGPQYCPPEIPLVGVSGDSIARAGFGLYGVPVAQSWAMLAQQGLNATQPVNLVNIAFSGDTIVHQRDVTFPTVLAPFYTSSRARNVLVIAAGTNDIGNIGHTGALALADYYSFADAAKAVGWRIVVCTILNRNAGAFFNTEQANFNVALRAGWVGKGYSALADVQAIPQLANPLDLTYFSDGIHPTIAGHALMAPVEQAAIQAAIT